MTTPPKRDDPTALQLGALQRLKDHPDFHIYLLLVKKAMDGVKPLLQTMILNEETLARHNFNAGALWGLDFLFRLIERRELSATLSDTVAKDAARFDK